MQYAIFATAVICIACIVFCAYLMVLSIRFLKAARKQKKIAEDYTKFIEIQTAKQFNKIAVQSPKDLEDYLSASFSRMLELGVDTDVSINDPAKVERLYNAALTDLLKYLGEETIAAIDYYYGKDFVIRWSQYAFLSLVSRGTIGTIISKKVKPGM